jgi:MoaA/NifB/PqqE/SkfB family radical SAM enzyme
MFNVTRMLCGHEEPVGGPRDARASVMVLESRRPVVVWNLTRICNLRCLDCYAEARHEVGTELSHAQGEALLDDLAAYGVPAVAFAGAEPLARRDTLDLMAHACDRGLRVTLATNGTLIGHDVARRIKRIGVSYVGVSLDGIGPVHDLLRGRPGAFDFAVRGIRYLKSAGQYAGLRLPLTPYVVADMDAIFAFIAQEHIDRVCFYHFVSADDNRHGCALTPTAIHVALHKIAYGTTRLAAKGIPCDVLIVAPGSGVAEIDWRGNVHPNHVSHRDLLGSIADQPFSAIWSAASGHHSISDPGSHLTDEEIALVA